MTLLSRRRVPRIALGVGLLAIFALATNDALAQAAPFAATSTREPSSRRLVTVTSAGDESEIVPIEGIVRERVADPDLQLGFERSAAIDSARVLTPGDRNDDQLARIWVDLTGKDVITLHVVDGAWERVLVREVRRTANPEVAWEEVGHIVELAVAALRAGEHIGVARADLVPSEPATMPAPPPVQRRPAERPMPAPPPDAKPMSIHAAVFYGLNVYGNGPELMNGPGLLGELAWGSGRSRWSAVVMGSFLLPSTIEAESASVQLVGGNVYAVLNRSLRLAPSSELALGVGLGGELVHAEPRVASAGQVRFAQATTDVVPAGRALVRYIFGTPFLRLFAGLGVDVPMASPRYLLSLAGDPVVLFEPWAARPFGVLGVETP